MRWKIFSDRVFDFFYSCINKFISFRSSICTLVWQTLGCLSFRNTLNEIMYTMWLERQFSSILNLLDLLHFIKMKIRVLINSLFSTPLNYLDNLTLGIMLKFKAIQMLMYHAVIFWKLYSCTDQWKTKRLLFFYISIKWLYRNTNNI